MHTSISRSNNIIQKLNCLCIAEAIPLHDFFDKSNPKNQCEPIKKPSIKPTPGERYTFMFNTTTKDTK